MCKNCDNQLKIEIFKYLSQREAPISAFRNKYSEPTLFQQLFNEIKSVVYVQDVHNIIKNFANLHDQEIKKHFALKSFNNGTKPNNDPILKALINLRKEINNRDNE